jgi:arylsulfatase A-like enzyme
MAGAAFGAWEQVALAWTRPFAEVAPSDLALGLAIGWSAALGAAVGAAVGASGLAGGRWWIAYAATLAGLGLASKLGGMAVAAGAPPLFGAALALLVAGFMGQGAGRLPAPAEGVLEGVGTLVFLGSALAMPLHLHRLPGSADPLAVAVDALVLTAALVVAGGVGLLGAWRPLVLAALLGAAAGGLLWPKRAPEPPLALAPRSDGRAPVVLVTVDGLRSDRLRAFGHSNPTTPELDRLAGRAAAFSEVQATGSWWLPSLGSIVTGLMPEGHGAGLHDGRMGSVAGPLRSEVSTLGEWLAESGRRSLLVSGDGFLLNHGFGAGFERISLHGPLGPEPVLGAAWEVLSGLEGAWQSRRPAVAVVDQALAWAGEAGPAGWFLWVHLTDLRGELRWTVQDAEAVGGVRQMPSDAYDAVLHGVDAQIGRLIAGLPDRTRFVVVGTSGQELGEVRVFDGLRPAGARDGHTLHQEQIRVPLLVGGWRGGGRSDEVLSTADVALILGELAGAKVPARLDGRLPASLGGPAKERVIVTCCARYGENQHAVRRGPLKLIESHAGFRLYDLSKDPTEASPVPRGDPGVDQLRRELGGSLPPLDGVGGPSDPLGRRFARWLLRPWSKPEEVPP